MTIAHGILNVFVVRTPSPGYGEFDGLDAPELPPQASRTSAAAAVRRLLADARWDGARFGSPDWDPLGDLIAGGKKVVIKPNWVLHENRTGQGLDALVTHASLIEAVLHYVVKALPASIIVGDAPIQGCDFDALLAKTGLERIVERFRAAGTEVSLRDFRCTTLPGGQIHRQPCETARGLDQYVLFDLGAQSLLEPVTTADTPFRVTMYDPQALKQTHGPGRHQYLVAREVIEADVVINLPKLKTHKKAGLTGALKNMVGMNGHKSYLPHHRQGSPETHGDCYPRSSRLKRCAEHLLDRANVARHSAARFVLSRTASVMMRLNRLGGGDGDVEGAWHGNDTVWRMCLDLQQILHYGMLDGTLAATPQRQVLNITDAIVAGEGEGPLAPDPVPLGIVSLGMNVAAVDWVHALLMGFDPEAIPMVRESFAAHEYPLADFSPDSIRVYVDGEPCGLRELPGRFGRAFHPSGGWKGHCELLRS